MNNSDPEMITFLEADDVLQGYGIARFKIDWRNEKLLITPIFTDGREDRVFDLTAQWQNLRAGKPLRPPHRSLKLCYDRDQEQKR